MNVSQRLLLLTSASLLALPGYAQQDFSAVEIETQRVADGLYMLIGSGGNIGLSVGDDGALIIDTQYAPLSYKIQAAVSAVDGGPVEMVINTHYHGDHAGGNPSFGNSGAIIVAHENVYTRLANGDNADAAGFPDLTYPDRVRLDWNGTSVDVIHVPPAHTDGDTIVHFADLNAIHMGDTYFNGGYPFVDVNSGGTFNGVITAGETALALANNRTRIIPGHGPLASRSDLAEWIDMLKTVRSRIQSLLDDGMDVDQILAAGPTAEWDAELGQGFINTEAFTRMVVQSLSN